MAVVEVNIVPLGAGASVSRYVKKALDILKQEGLKFTLTAMGTIVEDESLDKIMKAVYKMHREVLDGQEVKRVVTSLKIDERTDKPLTIEGKLRAVEDE